jgi:hypothetical protein
VLAASRREAIADLPVRWPDLSASLVRARDEDDLIDILDQDRGDVLPEAVFLEMGRDRGGIRLTDIATDVETRRSSRAGRYALVFIASRMRAVDFFWPLRPFWCRPASPSIGRRV